MRHLLSRDHAHVLAQLAFSRVLLAFDFDGTLAPIVQDQPGRLLGVRVGEAQSSAAGYYLRDQREIDRLLVKLVVLRESRPRP